MPGNRLLPRIRRSLVARGCWIALRPRWVLFVPGPSGDATDPATAADARDTFETLHPWLGEALGETVGYALTATFTVLVLVALRRQGASRWLLWLGYAAPL